MGESFSAQLSTGAGSFTIPIATPAARAGVGVSLALGYSTSAGHGVAGVGWDLAVPYIARQTDRGNPGYQDPASGSGWSATQDRFVFNGGQELVPIGLVSNGTYPGALSSESMPSWANGWQYFRPRVEGSFLRFFWSPDRRTWRVQDKNGSNMELGAPLDGTTPTGTLETDPAAAAHIFRWNLSRQYDSHGVANPASGATPLPVNVARFEYLVDGGTSYLSDVYDTPPAANAATAAESLYAHHVHLAYETRPDATVSYRRGWETKQSLRLTGVDVTSKSFKGGTAGARHLVHRYHLTYDSASHVSLLTSVQLEGRCGASSDPNDAEDSEASEGASGLLPATTCPRLPAMTFGYTHVTPYHTDGSAGAADLTGYEGFDERVTTMAASPPHSIDEANTDLFDINADGLPDVLVTMPGLYGNAHGVYFNGSGGEANAFTASTVGIQGILGEDLSTITLQNPNLSAGDVDGDGIIDLVHMPQVKTYSVYSPQGSGTSWVWQGRPVTTASQQSPKINLGRDGLDLQRMDVNGDGLVDIVLSTGTEMETFFALGRYPGGDGQFGHAAWTGATTASISNDPVATCVPWDGLPIQLSDSTVKVADMNGDGLPDIVRLQQGNVHYWPGRGDGHWGTQSFAKCPAGGFGEAVDVEMASSPWYSDPNGAGLHIEDVNGDGLDDLVQVRFDAVDVWLNVDGAGWTTRHVITNAPMSQSYLSRTRLVDMNGSGTRDILWGDAGNYRFMDLSGGSRPWMLSHVENGLGKTTDLEYTTSTALEITAANAKAPWGSFAPMPLHVVSEMIVSDNLHAAGQVPAEYITQYSYRDPVYDGRQREFRGFTTAREIHLGDPNNPDVTTESRFLLGECEDEGTSSGLPSPCTMPGRWRDNPREALKGLPVSSDVFDANGVYQSTAHHTYRLRKLYAGLDGRDVRHAFESSSDTFLYDTASGDVAPVTVSLGEVELELSPPAFDKGEIDIDPAVALAQHPLTVRSGLLLLHGTAGRARLQHSVALDVFGNTYRAIDAGNLGVDDVIVSQSQPSEVSNVAGSPSVGGWLWKTTETKTVGSNDKAPNKAPRHHTRQAYDWAGDPLVASAELVGTLPLVRTNDSGGGVAPAPPTASGDGWITTATITPDAFGNAAKLVAPNNRCRATVFETDYQQLPASDTIFVGAVDTGTGCGETPITSSADVYDRGLAAVMTLTDVHGEQTKTQYDGFGRITAVFRPDPVSGAASTTASMRVEYLLGTPFSRVHTLTETQDADATHPQATYREAWAYVDGMGRSRVSLEQADTDAGDAAPWIASGVATYDGKGAPERAYQPFFYSGDPAAFPLSTAVTSAYSRIRYDAFGRTIQTFALDGAVSIQTVYHALSTDAWDAADLEPGPHYGTYATAIKDGHGRAVATQERAHAGGAIEVRQTTTTYLSTGEPVMITRSRGTDSVVRWIVYDSLGRMVDNVEPNTSVGFNPDPTKADLSAIRSWRYAYNDSGDLVGTSDARGCGANYAYDAGGRALTEDYSPCTAAQSGYTVAPEVSYAYDQADADAIAGIPGFPINVKWFTGQLAAVVDRSGKTLNAYDGRGRATGIARRLVGPDGALAPRWYVQTNAYDAADRVITETTGAVDAPAAGGAPALDVTSVVSTVYSKRGAVKSVGSDHGAVIDHVTRDADGLPLEIGYADAAKTTSSMSYDGRRRLRSKQTYRAAPSIWTAPPASYFPAPTPNGPPSTFQLLLEDLDYTYDAVDNPAEITDYRTPSEWPAGAQPVTRKMQYDDLYRLTRIDYQYPRGRDPWTSPFAAEDQGVDPDRRRALPSPHVSFPNRVLWQTFAYDWLGNTTATDDDATGFYERSLGTITNGTATAGPYQLKAAGNSPGGDSDRSGSLSAAYDAAGNMTGLVLARRGSCLPAIGICSQRFVYDWDEVGRLVKARRWDLAPPGANTDPVPAATAAADLRYTYDANDDRALKAAYDANGDIRYAAYPVDTFELRGASATGFDDYERTVDTEVDYIFAHGQRLGRLANAKADEPSLASGAKRFFLEIADHLGSTSLVIDRATSELVEAGTYEAYGKTESDYRPARWDRFREDYRFTGKEEDSEIGIVYFGKRYLSAALGRWVSSDPLAIQAPGEADPNAYAYVHGAVLRAIDLVGLQNVVPSGGGAYTPTPEQVARWKAADDAARSEREARQTVIETWLDHHPKAAAVADVAYDVIAIMLAAKDVEEAFVAARSLANLGGSGASSEASESSLVPRDALAAGTESEAAAAAPKGPADTSVAPQVAGCSGGSCGPKPTCFVAGTRVATESGLLAIESLVVGDRVLASAEDDAVDVTAVSPAWRTVSLAMPAPDGSDDTFKITLLRSSKWLESAGASLGAWIGLTIEEMGLVGLAHVTDIGPAPRVAGGRGRVVLGTVNHLSREVRTIALEGADDRIETTPLHRFYSVDRHDWVPAWDLVPGEALAARGGPTHIAAITPKPGTYRVFNVEVEDLHTYQVTPTGVLVHNQCGATLKANKATGQAWESDVVNKELPRTQTNIEQQITIKSNGPSGRRTRMDAVGTESGTGATKLTEAKASPTAPLTPAQKIVHPELATHGGTVVGKGKGAYPGGTVIPPTAVDVVRKPVP